MYKVAIFKGKVIAKEKAVMPRINDKFNMEELTEFYHRMKREHKINYNNSHGHEVEYFCRYDNVCINSNTNINAEQ